MSRWSSGRNFGAIQVIATVNHATHLQMPSSWPYEDPATGIAAAALAFALLKQNKLSIFDRDGAWEPHQKSKCSVEGAMEILTAVGSPGMWTGARSRMIGDSVDWIPESKQYSLQYSTRIYHSQVTKVIPIKFMLQSTPRIRSGYNAGDRQQYYLFWTRLQPAISYIWEPQLSDESISGASSMLFFNEIRSGTDCDALLRHVNNLGRAQKQNCIIAARHQ